MDYTYTSDDAERDTGNGRGQCVDPIDAMNEGFIPDFEETPSEVDSYIRPEHYRLGSIEPIEVIEDWQLGFCLGNAVKYLCRSQCSTANARRDLSKAVWYILRELEKTG